MEARQRALIVAATLVTAVTRWLALSRTMWDWDESLFMLALRHYDVAAHHPHPPGFPLFIALAHLIRLDAFHALQAIAFVASIAIVPAMFLLARTLGADFATSLYAALLLAFFPNVWFYGGMALSDVPSMVLAIVAVALLLRERTYLLGAVLLGIAAGFRPQNLLIGLAPLLMLQKRAIAGGRDRGGDRRRQLRHRHREDRPGALLRSAARASGYIARTDSFQEPQRPSLIRIFDDFFIRPYRAPIINALVTLLVLIGLVRWRRGTIILLVTFAPFCLFAWLFLDRFSVSRFSIGYAPLFAFLAADALRGRRVQPFVVGLAIVMMVVWTTPALRELHAHPSPPAALAAWTRGHVPRDATLVAAPRMAPIVEALLGDYRRLKDDRPSAPWPKENARSSSATRTCPARRTSPARPALEPRAPALLRRLHRGSAARRLRRRLVLRGAGVAVEDHQFLVDDLPPGRWLTLRFYVPLDAEPPPTVTIVHDGRTIDRFVASSEIVERT